MATMTIRELVFLTNDREHAKGDIDIGWRAGRAVEKFAEFVRLAKHTLEPRLRTGERKKLVAHLKGKHLDPSAPCAPCPYQPELCVWRARLPEIALWADWRRREAREPGKPALWTAERTLWTYLSLAADGLWPQTKLKFKRKGGQKFLACGNNRVRLLAAMDKMEDKVEVEEP